MTNLLAVLIALQGPVKCQLEHLTPLRDRVSLTLTADREEYYVGEVMRLTITAKNTSASLVAAFLELRPLGGLAEVWYRRPGASEFVHLSDLYSHGRGMSALECHNLAPGEEYSYRTILSLSKISKAPRYLLFDTPGTYEFMVRYHDTVRDPNGVLESNVLGVDVSQPPAHETRAFEDYTPDLAHVAQYHRGRTSLSPESFRAAVDFISRHADSRYTPPVRAGLQGWLEARVLQGRATEEEMDVWERMFSDTIIPILTVLANPATLWPPNHTLTPVAVSVDVSDNSDPDPAVALESITCDDGCDPALDVADALFGSDDREFLLRAERTGGGSGRTYTINYSATDASGNKTTATATVVVPHDQGKGKKKGDGPSGSRSAAIPGR